jgi:hypothetical protein
MCQQGEAEILYAINSEKEQIYQKYESFQRGEIHLSDDELQTMAVRMLMLKDY